ncbi:MAG: hypothetical protein F4059_06715, partial [Gemmatimonadetes bacterium]|nr:hypothetical protein [Gemmatimonadota bacterium]
MIHLSCIRFERELMGQIGYGEGSWGRASAFSIATMGCAAIAMLVLSCGDGAVEPTPPDPPRPTSVTVAPATAELDALGATTRLSAQVRDQNGQVMAGASVAWSSSNASVATVDGAGLVTAAANGAATITATAGSASGAAVVTVMQSVASITVSPAARSIVRGDTVRLLAEAFDENNHRVQDAEFVWASSDVAVVRVDESGIVTGVGDGSATVTARVGEVSGTAAITVANPDRAVLVALYEATDGPNWMDATNWLTDAPLGEWYGVETDDQGRVTRVELRGNALNGVIPPEVGSLANLTRLNM